MARERGNIVSPRVPGGRPAFTPAQIKLILENEGLSLDEPLREQLDPTPAEPKTPARALATRLNEAQSQWFSTGGNDA